jgi:hypothetical protein
MSDIYEQHIDGADFSDIAPYSDELFPEKIAALVKEPGFEHAVRWVMPDVNWQEFTDNLLKVKSRDQFHTQVMASFLEMLVKTTTSGLTMGGFENIKPGECYTFITNHRDIVLDASFLNLNFIRHNMPTCEVAIGNNLLIMDWITDLVKLNGSFVVKRDTKVVEALEVAKHLSAYIHYAIGVKKRSVWIAQRQGRAKDSNDFTQESLVKMLSLSNGESYKENIAGCNLLPVSISYEFDPNDYLKACEFLMKKRDPEFKKSQRDDLFSMETGILQFKGRIHFQATPCITPMINQSETENRAEIVHEASQLIDHAIHRNYCIFPCNYIAFDHVEGTQRFVEKYTADDVEKFDAYLATQLNRAVEAIGDVTEEELQFMRHKMLEMYANPLKNKLHLTDVK